MRIDCLVSIVLVGKVFYFYFYLYFLLMEFHFLVAAISQDRNDAAQSKLCDKTKVCTLGSLFSGKLAPF